jgi:hypothetical protein
MTDTLVIGTLVAVIAVGIIASILINSRAETGRSTAYPYERTTYLLSKAERSFYEVLYRSIGPDYRVFPKVRIADIVHVKAGAEMWWVHFNKITSKHVDFLICSAATLTPVLVVELDDSSHSTAKTKNTDAFRDNVFQAAGLPQLRVPVRAGYNPRDIAAQVAGAISGV